MLQILMKRFLLFLRSSSKVIRAKYLIRCQTMNKKIPPIIKIQVTTCRLHDSRIHPKWFFRENMGIIFYLKSYIPSNWTILQDCKSQKNWKRILMIVRYRCSRRMIVSQILMSFKAKFHPLIRQGIIVIIKRIHKWISNHRKCKNLRTERWFLDLHLKR